MKTIPDVLRELHASENVRERLLVMEFNGTLSKVLDRDRRDVWEAATKAQMEKDVRDCFPITHPEKAILVHGLTPAPFPGVE